MESEEKGPASNGVSMTPSAKETFFHRLYRDVPLVQTLWGKGCEIHKKAEERLPGYAWIVSGPVHDAAVSVSANLMHIPKVGEYVELVDSTACMFLQGLLDKYPSLSRPPSEVCQETRDGVKEGVEEAMEKLTLPILTRRALQWLEVQIGMVEKYCVGLAERTPGWTPPKDENGASGTWSTLLSALSQLSQPALLYYSKWMRLARRKVRTMRRMGRPGAEFEDAQESPTSKRLTWPVQALQEIFLAPLYLLGLKGREKEEIPLVPVHGDGGSPNRPVDAERTREDGREGERLDEEALDEEERLDEEALDEEERLDEEALDEETPDEEDEVVDPDYVPPEVPSDSEPEEASEQEADEGRRPESADRPLPDHGGEATDHGEAPGNSEVADHGEAPDQGGKAPPPAELIENW